MHFVYPLAYKVIKKCMAWRGGPLFSRRFGLLYVCSAHLQYLPAQSSFPAYLPTPYPYTKTQPSIHPATLQKPTNHQPPAPPFSSFPSHSTANPQAFSTNSTNQSRSPSPPQKKTQKKEICKSALENPSSIAFFSLFARLQLIYLLIRI